jgi:signal transduction histidine kinase
MIADQVGITVKNDQLRQQSAVAAERQRIARDLHDSATQSLYGLVTLTEAGQAQLELGEQANLDRIFSLVGKTTRQALKEMRLFIYQLRAPDLAGVGLVGALQQRLSTVEGRANVDTRLLADEAIVLPEPVEQTFYWIAREALNNTLRHAEATAVTVYLRRSNRQVTLEVVDDGRGFDPHRLTGGGQGLAGMRERAEQIRAGLEVVSAPGRGTRVKISTAVDV